MQAPSETILTELGLMPYFEAVVGGEPALCPQTGSTTLWVRSSWEASGQAAIMVGDGYNDAAARNAEAGHPRDIRLQDPGRVARRRYVVDRFSDIPGAVTRLHAGFGRNCPV